MSVKVWEWQSGNTDLNTHLGVAFVGLVAEDLGHALDGYGQGDDGVLVAGGAALVWPIATLRTEHQVAGLAEQQLLEGNERGQWG